MRTVIDTSEVAHYWANQRQSHAKNSGHNFYYEGDTIYSYGSHFPIATLIDHSGQKIALFTTRGYSNTTAKHIGYVSSAASHIKQVFCHNPYNASKGIHIENIENIESFENACKHIAAKLPKSTKPEKYLSEIFIQREMLTEYCQLFNINMKSARFPKLKYIWIESKTGAAEATEIERKAKEKAAKQAEVRRQQYVKEQTIKDDEILAKWRKSPKLDPFVRFNVLENTFLRYNKAKKQVETTKGIEIPENVAKRFYNWLKRTVKSGGCDGQCEHKILGYSVNAVTPEYIHIGCHNITWDEINKLAKKLGWA